MNPRVAIIVFVLLTISTASIFAETKLDISGQVRVRGELDKSTPRTDRDVLGMALLRARFAVSAEIDSNTVGFIEIQDSREFEGKYSEDGNSGQKENAGNVDAHQAFLMAKNFILTRLAVKAGRFEFIHGNGRIFGEDNWDNFGLAWNGAWISYGDEPKLHVLAMAGPNDDYSDEYWIAAVMGELPWHSLSPLLTFENSEDYRGYYFFEMERYTAAVYGKGKVFGGEIEYNLAYQFGTASYDMQLFQSVDRLDIESWLLSACYSSALPFADKLTVKIGMDALSGDNKEDDRIIADFQAPFRSTSPNLAREILLTEGRGMNGNASDKGMIDLFIGIDLTIHTETVIHLNFHHFSTHRGFRTQVWSNGQPLWPNGNYYFVSGAKNLGSEIDLSVKSTANRGLKCEIGIMSFFSSKSNAFGPDHDPGYYAYSQMTVDF